VLFFGFIIRIEQEHCEIFKRRTLFVCNSPGEDPD